MQQKPNAQSMWGWFYFRAHYLDGKKVEDLDTEIDLMCVTAVRVAEDLPYDMITAQNCVSKELPEWILPRLAA